MSQDSQNQPQKNNTMKESIPQLIVGVIAILAIIFGLFYFNNQQENAEQAENAEGQEQASEQQDGQPTPTEGTVKPGEEYTVQSGDNLWKIAEKHYGSGYNYVDIQQANSLNDPDGLAEGQKLVIPSVEPKKETGAMAQAQPTKALQPTEAPAQPTPEGDISAAATERKQEESVTEYTVTEGDNLWKISEKVYGDGYGWVRIAEVNNIPNPDKIPVGMKMQIPSKG